MLDDKEVVLAVDVATWANDHILGRKASTLSSPWCPFNDRELFTSLSPESLLFEHGESNRFTTPRDGVFNSVTELMYPCGSPFGSSLTIPRGSSPSISCFVLLPNEVTSIGSGSDFALDSKPARNNKIKINKFRNQLDILFIR